MGLANTAPIVIVGGGVGGLALALGLARRDVPTTVLERAPQLFEIGAGIQLAPNALRVLDGLGVLDSVLADAVYPPRGVMMNAATGQEIGHIRFDREFTDRYGYPYVVTHRADLHGALVAACQASEHVTLLTGSSVHTVEEVDDDVRVLLEDGGEWRGAVAVGADGLHSIVRQVLIGDAIVDHDDVAYRGTVDYPEVPDRDGKDDVTWWVGPGLHLMQYPLRSKQLYNQVAVFTKAPDGPPDVQDWGSASELDRAFEGTCPVVRLASSQVGRERFWQMVDRDPAPGWSRSRITLLGDAAHPMLQNLAQGGCQALEDAAVLSHLLADGGRDVIAALAQYEAVRYPRTSTVQTWARRMRDIAHAGGTLAILRDQLVSKGVIDLTYFDWLYAWAPDA